MEFYRNLINENLVAFILLAAAAFFAFVFLVASIVLIIRKKHRRGAAVKILTVVDIILLIVLLIFSAVLIIFVFPSSSLSIAANATAADVNLFGLKFIIPGLGAVLTAMTGSLYGWLPLVVFAVLAILFIIVKNVKTYKVKRAKKAAAKPEEVSETAVIEQSEAVPAQAQPPVLEPAAEIESEAVVKQQTYEEETNDGELVQSYEEETDDGELVQSYEEETDGGELIQAYEEETNDGELIQAYEEETDDGELIQAYEEETDDEELIQAYEEDTDDEELIQSYEEETDDEELIQSYEEETDDGELIQSYEEETDDGELIQAYEEENEYEFDDLPISDDELLEQLSMFEEEAPEPASEYNTAPEPQSNPEPAPQHKPEPVPQYRSAPEPQRSPEPALQNSPVKPQYAESVRQTERVVVRSDATSVFASYDRSKYIMPVQRVIRRAAEEVNPSGGAQKQAVPEPLKKIEPVKTPEPVKAAAKKKTPAAKIPEPNAVLQKPAPAKAETKPSGNGAKVKSGEKIKTVKPEAVDTVKAPLKKPVTVEFESVPKTGDRADTRITTTKPVKAAEESEAGLPVKRRVVLQNRYNAVNVFSDYLNQKSRLERQRLEDSLNVITIK